MLETIVTKKLVFCVDGTNLVRSGGQGYGGPAFRAQEEADEQRLLAALSQLCDAREGLEIELFFDGAFRALRSVSPGLTIRFSRELSADEMILDRVRGKSYAGGGKITVVTADSELGEQVSQEGGRWVRVHPGASLESVIRAIEGRFK